MKYSKLFAHFVLLFTTPSLVVYPQANIPAIAMQTQAQVNPIFTYDDILNLLEELENGELEKRSSPEDLERINQFLTFLAKEGTYLHDTDEEYTLASDIQELLNRESNPYEYAYYDETGCGFVPAMYYDQGEFVYCKSWTKKKWDQTRKFVKKHKKEILIAAAIAAAITVVVIAVAAASAASAAAVAGAAGAAGAGTSSTDHEGSHHSEQKDEEIATPIVPAETPSLLAFADKDPILKAALEEKIALFKEHIAEDVVLQSLAYSRDPYDPSFAEKMRELGSHLAHETFEGISKVPQLLEGNNELRAKIGEIILPHSLLTPNDHLASHTENYEKCVAAGHQVIDHHLLTKQADYYTLEAKASRRELKEFLGIPEPTIGELPPPGNFSRGINVSKFNEIVQAGQETAIIADELGYTAREIAHLKDAGALEKNVARTYDSLVTDRVMAESVQRFQNAREFLKPYKGQYLPEIQLRELIQQTGIKTFPRPSGIPENYRIKLSEKPGDMKYVHPEYEGTYIRVMLGKPHSRFPHQREPYIIHMKDGNTLDKFGNVVRADAPEAHILIEEFIYPGN